MADIVELSDFVAIYEKKICKIKQILLKYGVDHSQIDEKQHFTLCVAKSMVCTVYVNVV